MSDPAFSPDAYQRLASAIADALEAQAPDAVGRATAGLTVSVYPPAAGLPFGKKFPSRKPIAAVFAAPGDLISAARGGDPAAVETALEALGALDVERAADLGAQVFTVAPWPELLDRAALALSRSARESSFDRLLAAIPSVSRAGFLLTQSPFPGCKRVSARLSASPVMRFEPFAIPTEAGWEAMAPAARQAFEAQQEKAAGAYAADDVDAVRSLLEYLGKHRCPGALAPMTKLYAGHPSSKVRLAAGHAIVAFGDPEGLDLLISLGDSSDERRRWFAVKAVIAKDPAQAVERLGGDDLLLDERRERVGQALKILDMDAKDKAKTGGAPWVLADPRWLGILARWVRDKQLGDAADALLRRFPAAEVARATAPAPKPKPKSAAKTKKPSGALAALDAGDGPGAWSRLLALGDDVRRPPHAGEAREVAHRTMIAARACLERIVERLAKSGYRFVRPDHALTAPPAGVRDQLDELESLVGALPLSLRAAYEHLGAIDLRGDHPAWPRSADVGLRPAASERDVWLTDPLVLVPVAAILDDVEEGSRAPFHLAFAGDPLTKAGYSGGTYQVTLPCLAADAVVEGEAHGRTFVEHLRVALRNGGFAGFEGMRDAPRPLLDALVAGCPPI